MSYFLCLAIILVGVGDCDYFRVGFPMNYIYLNYMASQCYFSDLEYFRRMINIRKKYKQRNFTYVKTNTSIN
jgi:hypothetical protein